MRRACSTAVVLAVLAACALVGLAARPASAAPCASGGDAIALVIDFGDGRVVAECIPVGATTNGAQLLYPRHQVRFSTNGLLCAIDGVPADGCGERTGGHYAFWSYWHGTAAGGWDYSSVGPGGWRVRPTVTEGWRWQPAGSASPSDPPPSRDPDPAATCTPAAPDSTTPTPAPDTVSMPSGSDEPGAPGGSVRDTGAVASTAPVGSPVADAPAMEPTTSSRAQPSPTSAGAAAPVAVADPGGAGGSPVGFLAGTGLVGALGASGALVARRRRASAR